jgi:hypothetical protein
MYQHDIALKDSLELPNPAVPEAYSCVLLEMMMQDDLVSEPLVRSKWHQIPSLQLLL